jgi:hypothetical protein
LRAIQENVEEGYVKAKKSGMEGECLSILRWAKEVSIEERHNKCQKLKKKSSFISFGVSRIKPLMSSKRLYWLFIKEIWISNMTYVKRILISEINKVICHFFYNDNKRKRVDE